MPFTHVEIKERKSNEIALLFAFLILVYTLSLIAIVWGSKAILGLGASPGLREVGFIFGISIFVALAHWLLSTYRLIDRVLFAVDAKPLDENDTYHKKLRNIVDEVSVATGGRHIETYVIPTPAVNACAITDFSGRSAIAVTEGLLAQLNRGQIESVIGHEVAHIVSGDSLSNTVLAALFALHEEAFRRISRLMQSRTRIQGRGGALILFIYFVTWVTCMIKTFCHFCISRQKEYRADAVSVQLTRNPLSLAEALDLISMKWRGVGMRGESLSSIFIADPGTESFSDKEGIFADWVSTHPPIESRVSLLLGMAHVGFEQFEKAAEEAIRRKKIRKLPEPALIGSEDANISWMIWDDARGVWGGPFNQEQILGNTGFSPDAWIKRLDEDQAKPAYEDSVLVEMFRKRYESASEQPSKMECPVCHVGLRSISYEGAPIDECPSCHGCYVDPQIISRIFSRQEYDFPDSVKRMGDLLLSEKNQIQIYQGFQHALKPLKDRKCVRCGASVVRKFYNEAYLVEVDQCFSCGLTWLDHQELEVLQYLFEKRQQVRDFNRGRE